MSRILFINIALFLLSVKVVHCQVIPRSHCRNSFRYLHDGKRWAGVVAVPSNTVDSVFRLTVDMALAARLPDRYLGELKPLGDYNAIIDEGLTLTYKVIFPIQEVLPFITSIKLNGKEYCFGTPPPGPAYRRIQLFYELYYTPPNSQQQQPVDYPNYDVYDDIIQDPRSNNQDNEIPPLPETSSIPPDLDINEPPPVEESAPPQNISTETNDEYERCGRPKKMFTPLIVNGDSTKHGEWPWLVAMFMKKVASLQFICSGSLISHNHVVTAAHCVVQTRKKVNKDDLLLKLGCHNIQDWTDQVVKTMAVDDLIVHSQYNVDSLLKNDIAVLKISRIEFTEYIMPVCLWKEDNDLSMVVGESASVVGWGRDENGLTATPEPRLSKVPIVSTDTCRASRMEFFQLTSNTTLCAGGRDGTGPCNGDSGGGLYLYREDRWTLRGIVSNSLKDPNSNTCNLNEYVVFTDATKYIDWIENIMNS